jgi:hypothetical protein
MYVDEIKGNSCERSSESLLKQLYRMFHNFISSFIQLKVRCRCLDVSFILDLFTHAFSSSHSVSSRERERTMANNEFRRM